MIRQRLWIPIIMLVFSLAGGAVFAQEKGSLININTADEAALVTLNQVGKTRAQAIIQYREAFGPFKTVEDLKKVSGIGDKVLEAIRSQITVASEQP